jgi:IS5 family transposase
MLCSTIAGTFTTSIGLWDRIKQRRKQLEKDLAQDDVTKKLKAQLGEVEKKLEIESAAKGGGSQAGGSQEGGSQAGGNQEEDKVGASLERSGALISRAFEEGYSRLGQRFAVGDAITENKLQAQIIELQQTVISVLQDAMVNERQLDRRDMDKLISASDKARERSLEALSQQRQRQMKALSDLAPKRDLGPARPRSDSGRKSEAGSARAAAKKAPPPSSNVSVAGTLIPGLFCRYSLSLQADPEKPLAVSFSPSGDGRCPACSTQIEVASDDCWGIRKHGVGRVRQRHGKDTEVIRGREIRLGQRFAVKSHMPDGRFACVLCSRFRDGDVICPSVDDLVDHVGKGHDMADLEREEDFDVRSWTRPMPKALPPPPPRSSRSPSRSRDAPSEHGLRASRTL